MSVITKDLGAVSAYGLALEAGFEGTEQEYAELLASYGTVAQEAADSAGRAAQAANATGQLYSQTTLARDEAVIAKNDAVSAKDTAAEAANVAGRYESQAQTAKTEAESARDTAVNAVDGFAAGAQQALDSVNEAGGNWKSLAEKQAGNSEAWAVGQRGGVDVPTTDPAYHNNAKYYAEQAGSEKTAAQTARQGAETAATNASQSATAAATSASAAAESARTLTIDTTLTQSGQAADASETGNKITSLKEDLTNIVVGEKTLTPTLGDYDGSKFVASTNRAYILSELGDIKTISIKSGLQFVPEANNDGIGSAFTVLRSFSSDSYNAANRTEKYLLVMVRKSDNSDITVAELEDAITFTYKESLASLRSDLTTVQNASDEVMSITGAKWHTGYYIFADGGITTANDRACTDFIPCNPSMSVTYIGENNNASVCGIAFYDGNFKFISGDKNSGTLGDPVTVTSPLRTAYLRVSTKLTIINQSGVTFNGFKNSSLISVAQMALKYPVYVDYANGNDSTGDGRSTNPYKTIQHAIDIGAVRIGIITGSAYNETINVNGGEIYLFAAKHSWNSTLRPNRLRGVIDGNSTIATALTIQNAKNVILEDIEVCNCTGDGCLIDGCGNVLLINCSFHDNGLNGIVLNYTNGVIRKCIAYNNTRDGFNMNYYGNTQFYDCFGYNNGDDGLSHHQGCTGLVNGGEFYNNTKGGIASPANGAQVDIFNAYCHDNGYGIWANADSGTEARTFRVWNCVLTNNSHYGIMSSRNTAIMYNCKITGNTDGQTYAPDGGQIIEL